MQHVLEALKKLRKADTGRFSQDAMSQTMGIPRMEMSQIEQGIVNMPADYPKRCIEAFRTLCIGNNRVTGMFWRDILIGIISHILETFPGHRIVFPDRKPYVGEGYPISFRRGTGAEISFLLIDKHNLRHSALHAFEAMCPIDIETRIKKLGDTLIFTGHLIVKIKTKIAEVFKDYPVNLIMHETGFLLQNEECRIYCAIAICTDSLDLNHLVHNALSLWRGNV